MQPATRTAIGLPRGFEIQNFTVDSMWRIMDTNFIMVITKQTIWLKDYFFVKYNYLSGYGNKRVEDLLLLLDGDINRFEDYMDELQAAGQLPNKDNLEPCPGKTRADNMLQNGWAQKVLWVSNVLCRVESESDSQSTYTVGLARATGQCPNSCIHGMCKHVHVTLNVAQMRGLDLDLDRNAIASAIHNTLDFMMDTHDKEFITVFDNSEASIVVVNAEQCTCVAASFGIHCVCKRVVQLITSDHNSSNDIPQALPHDTSPHLEPTPSTSSQSDAVTVACQKLDAMTAVFMNGDHALNSQNSVFHAINTAYCMMFRNNFTKKTRKTKIVPNSSCRRLIQQTLKSRKTPEHGYSVTVKCKRKRATVKPDGAFKRSKASTRKQFN